MSGRRRPGKLLAVLSPDRREVLCGACKGRLAGIQYGIHSKGWGDMPDEPRVVMFNTRGWERRADGVFWVPPEARRDEALGRRLRIKSLFGARFPTWLPVAVECPTCDRRQTFDPVVLDVDPNRRTGRSRGSITVIREAPTGLMATDVLGSSDQHG